ncbi:MAG: hypothetical protein DSZ23_04405, partial [Thermodesulfatator sp.]
MKRYFLIISVVLLMIASTARSSKAGDFKPFSPGNVFWKMETHGIWKDLHRYRFSGHFMRYETLPGGYTHNRGWTYHVEAQCWYYPNAEHFKEELTIRIIDIREWKANDQWDEGETTVEPLNNRSEVLWKYVTHGLLAYDPWLYFYPGMPWPHMIKSENHQNLSYLYPDESVLDIPLPLSVYATLGGLQEKLREEEANATWTDCFNRAIASPRIVSPTEHQLFKSGHVPLYFEFDCRYDDYSKNFFMIYLQRRVPKPGEEKFSFWKPVGIKELYFNRLKMRGSPLLYEARSFGHKTIHLDFDGKYTELRMKVVSWIWDKDNNKYIKSYRQPEWRHFRVGHPKIVEGINPGKTKTNLVAPDLYISHVKVIDDIIFQGITNTAATLFAFYLKNQGGSEDQEVPIEIECKKDGTPVDLTEIMLNKYDLSGPLLLPGHSLEIGAFFKADLQTLHSGKEKRLEIYVKRPLDKPTQYEFMLKIDPSNIIHESNEQNNEFTYSYQVKKYTPSFKLEPSIRVLLAKTTFEWKIGKGYKVTWKGTLIKPNRQVRVFLVTSSLNNPGGPQKRIALSPPSGFPFDTGKHTVTVPLDTPPGYYNIYLEMVDVPKWNTISDAVIHVVGKALQPGALSKAPLINLHRPDLVVSGFKGEILQPGQADHSGHATNDRRVQLRWTVKNIGDAPCDATVLRVRGIADGNAPLPSP